jgi:4-amino-4-deoxychorismate lyase
VGTLGGVATHVLVLLNRPSLEAPAHDPDGPMFRVVDPQTPVVSALDLGVTRGDGIFESASVGNGVPQALEHHLRRFTNSARALELPAPDLDAWRGALQLALSEFDPVEEGFAKLIYTRGIEGDGRPTGWVYVMPAPDFSRAREEGVRVVLLDRGYRHDVERTSPWLLAGAKTLSYAVNRSVMREAARRGADDVIFVSSDGYILEGPNSTVVVKRGNGFFTPGVELGILDGTTQANVFRFAQSLGFEVGHELMTPETLREADAIWLVSSVRHAAPVRELDGVPFPVDAELTKGINDYLHAVQE